MQDSPNNRRLWTIVIAGLTFGCLALYTYLRAEPIPSMPIRPPSAETTKRAIGTSESPLRIISGHHATVDRDALPRDGALQLILELSDEARGTGERSARIVSTDGLRINTVARPLPGAGTGVQLEIDPSILTVGRYMIQIDTVENHPLQFRRYVVEVK